MIPLCRCFKYIELSLLGRNTDTRSFTKQTYWRSLDFFSNLLISRYPIWLCAMRRRVVHSGTCSVDRLSTNPRYEKSCHVKPPMILGKNVGYHHLTIYPSNRIRPCWTRLPATWKKFVDYAIPWLQRVQGTETTRKDRFCMTTLMEQVAWPALWDFLVRFEWDLQSRFPLKRI